MSVHKVHMLMIFVHHYMCVVQPFIQHKYKATHHHKETQKINMKEGGGIITSLLLQYACPKSVFPGTKENNDKFSNSPADTS